MSLPALPTTTDHAAFMAECDAAITSLGQTARNTRGDLDSPVEASLGKAAAALRAELKTIEDRRREFVEARLRSTIDHANEEAAECASQAAAALPATEAAEAELKGAEARFRAAQSAYRGANARAEAARGTAARAAAELADLTRIASTGQPAGTRGMGAVPTTEWEMKRIRPDGR